MVMKMTSAVATVIQAVSPLLGTAAGAEAAAAGAAAVAAAAGAAAADEVVAAGAAAIGGDAAGACASTAAEPARRPRPRARDAKSFLMVVSFSVGGLQGVLAGLAGADAHDLLEVVDEDLS